MKELREELEDLEKKNIYMEEIQQQWSKKLAQVKNSYSIHGIVDSFPRIVKRKFIRLKPVLLAPDDRLKPYWKIFAHLSHLNGGSIVKFTLSNTIFGQSLV